MRLRECSNNRMECVNEKSIYTLCAWATMVLNGNQRKCASHVLRMTTMVCTCVCVCLSSCGIMGDVRSIRRTLIAPTQTIVRYQYALFLYTVDVRIMMRWRWMRAPSVSYAAHWMGRLRFSVQAHLGRTELTHAQCHCKVNGHTWIDYWVCATRQLKSHLVYGHAIEILLNRWTADA